MYIHKELIFSILALIPIVWLLFSIGKMRIVIYKAAIIALLISLVSSLAIIKMPFNRVLEASLEGAMLGIFPILWVIISAVFLYNITVKTKGMSIITKMLTSISTDRRIQALVLAFSFGGFLEAVAGFGTAVAIPAGIMTTMGFNPFLAAVICLVANTIPVAFGVLGIPIITLSQITSISLYKLSIYVAVQLFPLVIFLPLLLVYITTGKLKDIKGVIGISIVSGACFGIGQLLTAMYIGSEVAAVVGSLASLLVIVIWMKLKPIKNVWLFVDDKEEAESNQLTQKAVTYREAVIAWSPFIIVLILIIITRTIPYFSFLNEYPFTIKKQFYFGEGGKPLTFQLATGSGSIIFISAVLGGLIQKASLKEIIYTLMHTVKMLWKTVVTVISIMILAKIMNYSGMINSLALAIASISGAFYPVIAPVVGALGTFLTGSDTSSNVLFGNLQKETALQLDLNEAWITAANGSGATAGKMISPQSISIATAATGISDRESDILHVTLKYCIVYVIILGVLVFVFK